MERRIESLSKKYNKRVILIRGSMMEMSRDLNISYEEALNCIESILEINKNYKKTKEEI